MKRNNKIIGILVASLLLGGIFFGFKSSDDRNFQIVKNLDLFNSVFKELDMFYVDTINPKEIIEYGIHAMLSKTDPYTDYYPEEDNTLKEMTTGKFGGIGSVVRYYTPRKRVVIVEPSEGHPAAEAGLKAGDVILEINGKEMAQENRTPNELTEYVSSNLRGEPGTVCALKIDRPISDSTYLRKMKPKSESPRAPQGQCPYENRSCPKRDLFCSRNGKLFLHFQQAEQGQHSHNTAQTMYLLPLLYVRYLRRPIRFL